MLGGIRLVTSATLVVTGALLVVTSASLLETSALLLVTIRISLELYLLRQTHRSSLGKLMLLVRSQL